MTVEQVKYVIWAADMDRVRDFYRAMGAEFSPLNPAGCGMTLAGATFFLHSGGEGKRTWTGISLVVSDVRAAASEVVEAGGQLLKEIEDSPEEPAHLAFCCDTEGNEFMLSQRRA